MHNLFCFIAQTAPPEATEVDASQVIGMVIALVAVIYTLASSFLEIYRKKRPHVASKQEKKGDLDEFLKSMEAEDEEEEQHELTLEKPQNKSRGWPRPEEKFVFRTNIEDFKQKTSIEGRKLEIKLHTGEELISDDLKVWGTGRAAAVQKKEAPIHQLLKGLSSKKALIVAAEIIQPPIGFRKPHKFP